MRAFLAGLTATLTLAFPAFAEPRVWIVRDADSEMLLFGSVHVLPPGLAWRPAALDVALSKLAEWAGYGLKAAPLMANCSR